MITKEELQLSKLSYTDKDFASIYPDLLDLAKQLTNKWDPSLSNESDPGVVLLKEGAFIADHNNYNIDKNVLENFLPSATQNRSVRNITEMNGYTPRYYASATGDINITFNGNKDVTKENFYSFTIPAYSIVLTNEDENITYTQIQDLNIGQIGLSTTCKFMEGSLVQLTVNNSGTILLENLDENNRVYFPDQFVAENGVFINNVDSNYHDLWTRNNYLLTQPTGSKIYKVDYDSRIGLPYIEFPSDIATIIGNGLEINYISTTGTIGNVKAGTLVKVKSPTTFTTPINQEINLVDDFTISNQTSILNGKDPETINQMYQSFKRIVGTFDTLVTRRDYENAAKEMADEYLNPLVSNDVVTDIRTDYNNTIKVVTFDEYGVYYENASLAKGITSCHLLTDSTKPDNPNVGDVILVPAAGESPIHFELCTAKKLGDSTPATWKEISNISYREFVNASEVMTPYDLCIYALKAFSMADYQKEKPGFALNKSFTQADQIDVDTIKTGFNECKCINHTFKDPESDDIFCFKNNVPLNITIIPYSKVTLKEKNEIIENIYKALTQNFNASKVDFGEELNYDEVVDVILASDSRIKNIRLEDFQYSPVAMMADGTQYQNGTEESLYENSALLVDLIAKNVLAGRVCLFDFDTTFSYGYGQVGADNYSDIGSLATETKIDVKETSESTTTLIPDSTEELPSVIHREPISFTGIDPSSLVIQIFDNEDNLKNAGEVIGLNPLEADHDFELETGWLQLEYTVNGVYESRDISPNENTIIKIHANSDYTYNPEPGTFFTNPDIKITIEEKIPNSTDQSERLDFQYNLKENEYIEIAYPNYNSTVIYPTYCNYRFISSTNNTVYSNVDYKLQSGDFLYIMYSSDSNTKQYITYKAGDVIRTTFNMHPTANVGTMKSFGADGTQMIMTTLGSGEQIELREKLETKLTGLNIPCHWIINNGNALFKEIPSDNPEYAGKEGYTWRILESGEYFIYSNSNLDSMVILGAGTKLIRSMDDTSQWVLEDNNSTSIEAIHNNGFKANIKWRYFDFSVKNLIFDELNIVTLGYDDQVSIVNWETNISDIPQAITNNWVPCSGIIYYKIKGKQTVLKKLNTDDTYLIRSRLDLVTDSYNGQQLINGNQSHQTVKVTVADDPETQIIITPPTPGEGQTTSTYLQSSVPLDFIGSDNLNIDLITANTILNFMTYTKKLPTIHWGVAPAEEGTIEILEGVNGKYVIAIRSKGYVDFPLTYENKFNNYIINEKQYILPVFLTGNINSNPITATFIRDPQANAPGEGAIAIPATTEDPIRIEDYNITTNPLATLSLDNSEMYLLSPLVPTGITPPANPEELGPDPTTSVHIKDDIILRLSWDAPSEVEIITVYDPKIITGINSGISNVSNIVGLQAILDRMNELVATSNKPNLKPYYINEPEQSIAIQDPDFSNPNILWDKNNVANIITIPQIIIPSDNIDIIK